MDVIRKHTTKLLSLSENLQKWEQSEYGDIIVICNSDSLKAIRQCWEKYNTPSRSNATQRREAGIAISESMADESLDFGNITASYGALAIDSRVNAVREGNYFWSTTKLAATEFEEAEYANPLILYSTGAPSKFAVPRESSPHSGFHLSMSHPKVDPTFDSPYKQLADSIKVANLDNTIGLGVMQLLGWCNSFKDFIRRSRKGGNSLQIRVFVGDPCAFCFALDQRRTNAVYSPLAGYIRPWVGKVVELDGSCYTGQTKLPAPLSFNVVDAADVIDKVGLLNLLVSVIPLLQSSPSTTISTDTRSFLWGLKDNREPELLTQLLCGNIGNVCSLLGVAPVSYLTGIATGDQHDIPVVLRKGFSNRIIWKLTLFGDASANESQAKLSASAEDLADMLYDLYLEMPHHDKNDIFKIMAAQYRKIGLSQYHNPQCTRRGFAALLAFLKPRICVDWPALMSRLIGKLEAKTDISTEMGYLSLQDLYLEMHFFGVYTAEPLQRVNQQTLQKTGLGVLTCVAFTIPRSNLNPYYQTFMRMRGGLFLAFQLHFVKVGRDIDEDSHHIFSSTTPMFGKLRLRSDQTYEVLQDQKGWDGKADLHIFAYVPTHLLLHPDGSKKDIGVLVRMMREWSTVLAFQDTNVPAGEMGFAKLSDSEHVLLLKSFPQLQIPSPSPVAFSDKNIAFSNESFECSYPNIHFQNGTFTTRITFREGIENQKFFESIRVQETTPCTMLVAFGPSQYRCTFPFPITPQVTIRRARKSGYIEVVTKLSSPSEKGGYFTNPFPVIKKDDEVCNWNLSSIHFGRVPRLNFNSPTMKDWVDKHLMNMFSDQELRNFGSPLGKLDALTEYKRSIYTIFTRLVGSNDRVFNIKASPNATATVVLFVTGLFLDDPGRAIMAEAYAVVPSLIDHSSRLSLDVACQRSCDIVVGTQGSEFWKTILPGMLERCRDFEHSSSCKSSSHSNCVVSLEAAFSCDCHTLGIEFLQNKAWRDISNEARRVAISSIFAAPFVESSRGWLLQQIKHTISGSPTNPHEISTNCCRAGCTNEGLKKCSRCGNANYCSKECQLAHWKETHKAECKSKEPETARDSSASTTSPNPPSNRRPSNVEPSQENTGRLMVDRSPRISRTETGEIRVSRWMSLAELSKLGLTQRH